jgi:predicted RNA-binding Zn ribbon-like protein
MKPKARPVKSPATRLFRWQDHHFINRQPALDFANTVVYRHRPDRRDDRIATLRDVDRWRRSAAQELGPAEGSLAELRAAREAIDGFFRATAASHRPDVGAFHRLLRLYARYGPAPGLRLTRHGLRAAARQAPERRPPLIVGLLHAAVELAFSPELERVKICPACGWLFVDRTRNRSKRWCITALCGNRNKMRRYYRRSRARTSASP